MLCDRLLWQASIIQDPGALSESPGEGKGPSQARSSFTPSCKSPPTRLLAGQTAAALGDGRTVSIDFGVEVCFGFLSLAAHRLALI